MGEEHGHHNAGRPLHTLPFAALMRGNHYLVEWKPIHSVLSATVVVPPNTKLALEMLVNSMRSGAAVQERGLTVPVSFPPLPS